MPFLGQWLFLVLFLLHHMRHTATNRDGARQVLVAMAVELGPPLLPYVFNVLADALPDKGYTSHVLGFTTHAVLAAVAAVRPACARQACTCSLLRCPCLDAQSDPDPGAMDESLSLVLPIVETELFGEVADAKEAGALAGSYKEAAKGRGYDTYQLCAAMITVQDHVAALLEPVCLHGDPCTIAWYSCSVASTTNAAHRSMRDCMPPSPPASRPR